MEKKAKEKAQELFTEFRYVLSLPGAPLGDKKDELAIQCALTLCEHAKASECEECGKYHNVTFWSAVSEELKLIIN